MDRVFEIWFWIGFEDRFEDGVLDRVLDWFWIGFWIRFGSSLRVYRLLRNRASGPDVGWILVGNASNGRPSTGRTSNAFPIGIRPKSGPEARVPARKHYGIT